MAPKLIRGEFEEIQIPLFEFTLTDKQKQELPEHLGDCVGGVKIRNE